MGKVSLESNLTGVMTLSSIGTTDCFAKVTKELSSRKKAGVVIGPREKL